MPLDLLPDVAKEHGWWLAKTGNDDPYAGTNTVGIFEVLRAHFLIVDFFAREGSGIGGYGPKSLDLLHSCMYRQFVSIGATPKWESDFEICATLFYGLIKDHPFHDANKRTAFLTCVYHLEKIGRCLTISHQDFEDFTVDVADSNLRKYSRYRHLAERKSPDAEVIFISKFLRDNSRIIDKRYYTITFRQLDTILRRFGYELSNPRHNNIDVVRKKSRRRIFGIFGEREQIDVKVCQIGFPSWTSQVGQGAIKTIRKETKLDYEHGVDSATFFHGEDPISIIIAKYQQPLRHLANR